MPEAGLEPARGKTPRDFKSLASTKFRHPGTSINFLSENKKKIKKKLIVELFELTFLNKFLIKSKMKIAITSDIHLKSYSDSTERYNALENIFKKIKDKNISHLIIAGDLFDKDYNNYSDFDKLCNKFPFINILAIPGNHDYNIKNEYFTAKNLTIIAERPQIIKLNDLHFLFIPYISGKSIDEVIVEFAQINNLPEKWVLIGHGDYLTTNKELNLYEKGLYMPITSNLINKFNPLKVILGHIHKPSLFGKVIYPGSPCGIDITETGRRRFLIFDTYSLSFEEEIINTDLIYFIETINLFPVNDQKNFLKEKIDNAIKKWDLTENEHNKVKLKLILKGYTKNKKEILEFAKKIIFNRGINLYDDIDTSQLKVIELIDNEKMEVFERVKDKLNNNVKNWNFLCSIDNVLEKAMEIIFEN